MSFNHEIVSVVQDHLESNENDKKCKKQTKKKKQHPSFL